MESFGGEVAQMERKFIIWNSSWKTRFGNKLVKTQMAPIGASTRQKGNDQWQHVFSLLYVYSAPPFDILYEY